LRKGEEENIGEKMQSRKGKGSKEKGMGDEPCSQG